MGFNTSGSFPASLAPAQKKLTLQDNYLSFNGDAAGGDPALQKEGRTHLHQGDDQPQSGQPQQRQLIITLIL